MKIQAKKTGKALHIFRYFCIKTPAGSAIVKKIKKLHSNGAFYDSAISLIQEINFFCAARQAPTPIRLTAPPPLYPQLTCARSPTIFQVPVAPISNFHHQLAGTVSLDDVVNSSFKGVDGSAACNTAGIKSNAAIAVISLKKS